MYKPKHSNFQKSFCKNVFGGYLATVATKEFSQRLLAGYKRRKGLSSLPEEVFSIRKLWRCCRSSFAKREFPWERRRLEREPSRITTRKTLAQSASPGHRLRIASLTMLTW